MGRIVVVDDQVALGNSDESNYHYEHQSNYPHPHLAVLLDLNLDVAI
jgi:hypothetical protein